MNQGPKELPDDVFQEFKLLLEHVKQLAEKGEHEEAHIFEDMILTTALVHVAGGVEGASELAILALQSTGIKYNRGYH